MPENYCFSWDALHIDRSNELAKDQIITCKNGFHIYKVFLTLKYKGARDIHFYLFAKLKSLSITFLIVAIKSCLSTGLAI